jgi:hypothetical protein
MDDLRGKYRFPYRGFDMDVGSNSAVLTQTFVAESIRRDQPRDDGLNAFRGAVNALIISLAFWAALGLAIFMLF